MEDLVTNLAINPHRIKKTVYILPESEQIFDKFGYPTLSAAIDGVALATGRQARFLPGVGPRTIPDFLAFIGADHEIPPEYKYTARERETQRLERNRYAGLPTKTETARIRAEIEAYDREKEDLFRAELSRALGELEPFEEEVPQFVQAEEVPQLVQAEQLPRPRFNKAPTRQEASLCSEKLSELVALAALYCAPALDRALDRAAGQTLEALEAELTAIVEMNRPVADNLSRRRLKRDLS